MTATPAEHERFCLLRAIALYGPDADARFAAQGAYADLKEKIEQRQHRVDSIITVALDVDPNDGDVAH